MAAIGKWLIAEGSGGTTADEVGSADLTLTNTAWSSIAAGDGVRFDSLTDTALVSISGTALDDIHGTNFATFIWTCDNMNAGAGGNVMPGYFGTAASRQLACLRVDGNLRCYFTTTFVASRAHGISDANAHTIACRFDFSQGTATLRIVFNVDGVDLATTDVAIPAGPIDLSSALNFGLFDTDVTDCSCYYLSVHDNALAQAALSSIAAALAVDNDADPEGSSTQNVIAWTVA